MTRRAYYEIRRMPAGLTDHTETPRAQKGRGAFPFFCVSSRNQQQLSLQPQLLLHPQPQLQLQPQLLLQLQPQPQLQPQLQPPLPLPQPFPLPQQQNRMMIRMMIQQHPPPPKPLLFHIKQIPPVRCEAHVLASVHPMQVSADGSKIYSIRSVPACSRAVESCSAVIIPAAVSRWASVRFSPLTGTSSA